MGQEIKCRVDFSGQSSEGKALLETSEIIFRGAFRLKIPFQAITALDASKGRLSVLYPDGHAVFHIGKAADKWADKIRHPPSRLDKLGVKPGTKVHLIGRHDDDFRRELTERGAVLSSKKPDLVFLSVKEKRSASGACLPLGSPGLDHLSQGYPDHYRRRRHRCRPCRRFCGP